MNNILAIVFGIAGIVFYNKERKQSNFADSADLARETTLPTINGDSVYALITCSGGSIAESHLFSEKDPVLLGRIRATVTLWETVHVHDIFGKHLYSYVKDSGHTEERRYPYSTHFICEKNEENMGSINIEAKDLDLADWQDVEYSQETMSWLLWPPKNLEKILQDMQVPLDSKAQKYTITKEWIKGTKVSIFANVKKIQNDYEISKPKNQSLVITSNPDAVIKKARDSAKGAESATWISAILAVALFISPGVLFIAERIQIIAERIRVATDRTRAVRLIHHELHRPLPQPLVNIVDGYLDIKRGESEFRISLRPHSPETLST